VQPLPLYHTIDLVVHLDASDGQVSDGAGDVDERRVRFGAVDDWSVVFVGVRRQHDVHVPRASGHVTLGTVGEPADHQQRTHEHRHLHQTTINDADVNDLLIVDQVL